MWCFGGFSRRNMLFLDLHYLNSPFFEKKSSPRNWGKMKPFCHQHFFLFHIFQLEMLVSNTTYQAVFGNASPGDGWLLDSSLSSHGAAALGDDGGTKPDAMLEMWASNTHIKIEGMWNILDAPPVSCLHNRLYIYVPSSKRKSTDQWDSCVEI